LDTTKKIPTIFSKTHFFHNLEFSIFTSNFKSMTSSVFISVNLQNHFICALKIPEGEMGILGLIDSLHDQGFTLQQLSEAQYNSIGGGDETTFTEVIESWEEDT
jgi:hypothetical protein